MQKYRVRKVIPLLLMVLLLGGLGAAGARAQCGGNHSSMHDQNMGHMGSGQMGMYGNPAPVQPDPNAGYVAPAPPPAQGYTGLPDTGGYGQMMGQGNTASGPGGHMGH